MGSNVRNLQTKSEKPPLQLFVQPRGGANQHTPGSNCYLVVYGRVGKDGLEGDGVLVDFGIHPAHWTPQGWSQKFPDIRDLLDPRSPVKLRGIFLSHGHDDHIGALVPYAKAGYTLPPVHAADPLTLGMVQEKLRGAAIRSHHWPELREGRFFEIMPGFTIEGIPMGHSMPGSGYLLKTADAGVFFSSDFKLDQTTLTPCTDLNRLAAMGRDHEVNALFLDSTRAAVKHPLLPEAEVRKNLLAIAERHRGQRLNIVITGSGYTESLARAGWLAAQSRRILIYHGTSLERSLRAMNKAGLGLDRLVNKPDLHVASRHTRLAREMTPSYLLNVMGSMRGGNGSTLARASRGEDKWLKLGPGDVVIFSTKVHPRQIPQVNATIAGLRAQGVTDIYFDQPGRQPRFHASGHEHADGLQQLATMIQPQTVVGLYGSAAQREACRMLFEFNRQSAAPGTLRLDNGGILCVTDTGGRLIAREDRPLTEMSIRPLAAPRARPPEPLAA